MPDWERGTALGYHNPRMEGRRVYAGDRFAVGLQMAVDGAVQECFSGPPGTLQVKWFVASRTAATMRSKAWRCLGFVV
jgi:hypothetical protein